MAAAAASAGMSAVEDVIGEAESMLKSLGSSEKYLKRDASEVVSIGGSLFVSASHYVYYAVITVCGLSLFLVAAFGNGINLISKPLFDYISNLRLADAITDAIIPDQLVYLKRFARAIIRLICLSIYLVFSLIRGFFKYAFWILFFIALTAFLLTLEASFATMADNAYLSSDVVVRSSNVGLSLTNGFLAVTDIVQPISNTQTDFAMQSTIMAVDKLANPTGFGRRRVDYADMSQLAANLKQQVNIYATLITLSNEVTLLIHGFLYDFVIPILEDIIIYIEVVLTRTYCFFLNPLCATLQVLQETVADAINAVASAFGGGQPVQFQCDASQLSGMPSVCNGQGVFWPDITILGIYPNSPANSRRVLTCDLTQNACESIDSQQMGCHSDAERGCPMTRRALTRVGHVLNMEDLEVDDCYQININNTALYDVCLHGWERLDGAVPQRRLLNQLFPEAPLPVFWEKGARRQLQDPAALGEPLKLPRTNDPYKQFLNMIHIGRSLIPSATNHSQASWTNTFTDSIRLFKSRRLLYQLTKDVNVLVESTALSDRVPMFSKWQRIVIAYKNLMTLKNDAPFERSRRKLSFTSNCPSGYQYCADGTCILLTQQCSSNCRLQSTLDYTHCYLQRAEQAVNGWDPVSFISGTVDCWRSYQTNPDTHPYGPSAATSSTLVWCFPMYQKVGYAFPMIDFNARTALLCGDNICTCPNYYSGEFDYSGAWFSYIPIAEYNRLLNGIIALQWAWSRITGPTLLVYPDWIWYSFWSLFPLPIWWTRALGNITPNSNSIQTVVCFVVHLGDVSYLMLLITVGLAFWTGLRQIIMELMIILSTVYDVIHYCRSKQTQKEKLVDYIIKVMNERRQQWTENINQTESQSSTKMKISEINVSNKKQE